MINKYSCKGCGKELEWYRGRMKLYCSTQCRIDYTNKKRREYYIPVKRKQIPCQTCGKLTTKIYCNYDCYPRRPTWQALNRYKKHLENSRQLLNRANSIVFVND